MSRSFEDTDRFEDVDVDISDNSEIAGVISQLGAIEASCSVNEIVRGDDDLPVCFKLDNYQWEEQFYRPNNLHLHGP